MKKGVLFIGLISLLLLFFSTAAWAQTQSSTTSNVSIKKGTGVTLSLTLTQKIRNCRLTNPNCPNNQNCPNYPNCPRNGLKNKRQYKKQNGIGPNGNGNGNNKGRSGQGRGRGGKGGGKGGSGRR